MPLEIQLPTNSLLESNPEEYLRLLKLLGDNGVDLKNCLNNTDEYNTWYSSSLICLVYIVGKLKRSPESSQFYGSNTEVSNELGIKIFNAMIKYGADVNVKNYYGESFKYIVFNYNEILYASSQRKENEAFLSHVRSCIE